MRRLCLFYSLPIVAAIISSFPFSASAQWSVISPPELIHHFREVSFVDEMHGYAAGWLDLGAGVQSLGARTSDGGATWKTETFEKVEINAVHFTDANHGFMAGRSYLTNAPVFERTTDGGKTWTDTTFADMVGGFEALDFIDSTYGIVGGGDPETGRGYILQTYDGGKTFDKVLDAELTHIGRIDLINKNTAYVAAGEVAGGENVIYKTVNLNAREDKVWTPMKTFEGFNLIAGFSFIDEQLGYVVLTVVDGSTFGGEVYKTTDGGESWNRVLSTTAYTLVSVDFIDGDNGFAVGSNAAITRTTDGGEHWTDEVTFATQLLTWVDYVSPTVAYAVGTDGTIMKYTAPAGVRQSEEAKGLRLRIAPNPTLSISSVAVEGGNPGTSYHLVLYNGRGELLSTIDLPNGHGEIRTEGMPKGACFYRVMKGGTPVATGSLIVE